MLSKEKKKQRKKEAHQMHKRGAERRRVEAARIAALGEPIFIRDWDALAEYIKSDPSPTHYIELGKHNGHIYSKDKSVDEWPFYLSTHTFYGSQYKESTRELQKRGFWVVCNNWDDKTEDNKQYGYN